MKTKILSILGFLAIGTVVSYGIQTDQPKMNGKLKVTTLSPEETCYTGKPYSKELGAYVFNARSYDPQISRWTTADPSGFPDGANNHVFGGNILSGVDPTGLDYTGIVASGASASYTFAGSTYVATNNLGGGTSGASYLTKASAGLTTTIPDQKGGVLTPATQGTVTAQSSAWGQNTGRQAQQADQSSLNSPNYGWTLTLDKTTGNITVTDNGGATTSGNNGLLITGTETITGSGTKTVTIKWNVAASGIGTAGVAVTLTFTSYE